MPAPTSPCLAPPAPSPAPAALPPQHSALPQQTYNASSPMNISAATTTELSINTKPSVTTITGATTPVIPMITSPSIPSAGATIINIPPVTIPQQPPPVQQTIPSVVHHQPHIQTHTGHTGQSPQPILHSPQQAPNHLGHPVTLLNHQIPPSLSGSSQPPIPLTHNAPSSHSIHHPHHTITNTLPAAPNQNHHPISNHPSPAPPAATPPASLPAAALPQSASQSLQQTVAPMHHEPQIAPNVPTSTGPILPPIPVSNSYLPNGASNGMGYHHHHPSAFPAYPPLYAPYAASMRNSIPVVTSPSTATGIHNRQPSGPLPTLPSSTPNLIASSASLVQHIPSIITTSHSREMLTTTASTASITAAALSSNTRGTHSPRGHSPNRERDSYR